NHVCQRHFAARLLDGFELGQYLGRDLVDRPVLLRRQANARAVGTATLVATTEGGGRRPGGGHQFGDRNAGGRNLGLQVGDVGSAGLVNRRRQGVLPEQIFLRNFRAHVAGLGTEV